MVGLNNYSLHGCTQHKREILKIVFNSRVGYYLMSSSCDNYPYPNDRDDYYISFSHDCFCFLRRRHGTVYVIQLEVEIDMILGTVDSCLHHRMVPIRYGTYYGASRSSFFALRFQLSLSPEQA